MNNSDVYISVVIPVYNSSTCLPELMKQLIEVLENTAKRYEVILVEDSSPDNSWEVVEELVSKYPYIKAIRLMQNSGQAKATICGLSHAQGEIIVTMDDDLQHRPDQLSKLLVKMESSPNIDCIFGTYRKKRHKAYRNIGSKIIHWLNRASYGLPKDAASSSFRVMRRPLVGAIIAHKTQNPAISVLLFAATNRIMSIPVEHAERFSGESNYTLSKQIRLALDNITNVTMFPLRTVSVMGIGICFVSLIYSIVVMTRYFSGHITVPGWTTVVILISFFSGFILLAVGIIGEYLVRVLREVRGFPQFIIRERVGFNQTYEGKTGNREG